MVQWSWARQYMYMRRTTACTPCWCSAEENLSHQSLPYILPCTASRRCCALRILLRHYVAQNLKVARQLTKSAWDFVHQPNLLLNCKYGSLSFSSKPKGLFSFFDHCPEHTGIWRLQHRPARTRKHRWHAHMPGKTARNMCSAVGICSQWKAMLCISED